MSTIWSSHAGSGFVPASDIGSVDVLLRVERRDEVVRLEDEADAVPTDERELLLRRRADLDVAEEDLARA